MKTIAIIGAGAAGLMTAAAILEHAEDRTLVVHLFDKNTTPGKKVLLSGGGRCNVTTTITDKKILSTKYVRGWDFIKSAMGKFSPKKCYEWFESHGVPLKKEGERVFPVSDNGGDIVGVFGKVFDTHYSKIRRHYGEGVHSVSRDDTGKYIIHTTKGIYTTDVVVIATGGNAYSHTGSTGDGYAFARALDHSITILGPSLSSFVTGEGWMHNLSGTSLENARLTSRGVSVSGNLLLTHFGISGPLAFMFSSHLAWEKIEGKTSLFSPLADMGRHDWDIFLRQNFSLFPKKTLANILSLKLPKRWSEAFVIEYFEELSTLFVGGISRTEREKISTLLGDGISITLQERRAGEEFVTAGGVSTEEISTETCESKLHKNLYFVGEILNVDGYTGGFSLQICWASGYIAGKNISEKIL